MKMKFEITGGLIRIPVKLNGKKTYYFHFDTGAKMTTITKEIASEVGVKINENETTIAKTAVNELKFALGTLDSILIGDELVENHVVRIHNHPKITSGCISGVIGHNFFKNYLVGVDYQSNTLYLTKDLKDLEELILDKQKFTNFKYFKDTHLVAVESWINDKGPLNFILDTGAGGTVINADILKNFNLETQESNIVLAGPGGTAKAKIALIDKFRTPFKSLKSIKPPIIPLSHLSSDEVGGIIGYNIIKDGKLIINYPEQSFTYSSTDSN